MNNYSEIYLTGQNFCQSLPTGLLALIVLVVGFCGAALVRYIVIVLLEYTAFNRLCDKAGFSEFLRKGEVSYSPAKLIGVGVYWVFFLTFVSWAFRLMGVRFVEILYKQLESAFPAILATCGISGLGYAIVSFLANVVRTIGRNAAFPFADPVSKIIKWLGLFLVLIWAADQLGAGTQLIAITFLIVLAGIVFGLALAFGLGCKDLAREAMVKFLHHLKEKNRNARPDLEG